MPSSREDAQAEYNYNIEVEAKAKVLEDVVIPDLKKLYENSDDIIKFGDLSDLIHKYQNWRNEL